MIDLLKSQTWVCIDGSVAKRAGVQMNEEKNQTCWLKAVYVEEKFHFEQHWQGVEGLLKSEHQAEG